MSEEPTPRPLRSSRGAPTRDEPMLVLTGMSGAGRSTMANVLEDLGWYVVDNLPPQMLPQLLQLHEEYLARTPEPMIHRVAAVVDVRSHGVFADFGQIVAELGRTGHRPSVVFLDATDEALVRRFESVRRPHPLQASGRLLDGIQRERALLGELRSEADVILDTSGLNVHQLAAKAMSLFAGDGAAQLRLAVMSFGFKYGVPAVAEFVLSQPGAKEFVDDVEHLMHSVVKGFIREGRRYVTLALGCTGGKHRSVAIAEQLAERLRTDTVDTFLVHRDLGRE